MMFTGAISNDARLYSGPLVLNQPVQIRTRALLNGTNWSALNEASFDVARAGIPLRITELHFNPSDSAANEFLELQNIGGAPVDLSGMYFDGITFTFNTGTSLDPGARLVLATDLNPAAFATRYPGVEVFGHYGGSLNNGGERITLFDRSGNIITSVDYDDAGAWPTQADGGGRSLELRDANGDPDDPANWQASSANGGSPGTINSAVTMPAIRLSEVMAENGGVVNHEGTFPDWIEIHNAGAAAANLSGWSISDDANARKFVLPANTVLAAQSYLTIWCDGATTSGLHAGFALNRSGGTIALFDAATNRVDVFSYGLQLTNFTVARVDDVWRLANPTPGAANTAAATASSSSLVINEWQANAPAGQSDWIELHNTGVAPVELRGIYLSNTSAVHRVASHSYIAAGGFAQLLADEQRGPDHLDFKLAATGGTIVLLSQTAAELDRVTYTNALEGVTRGRFPDATANVVNFPGSASPGASNYVNNYTGPVLNEVFARNQSVALNEGRIVDYVELFNPSAAPASLAGMSLSVNSAEPGQYVFPISAAVPANGHLVIWCDGSREISFLANNLNTGRSLDGESGGVYLFNAQGQLVNSIEYGFQVANLPIGLTGGSWRLLSAATPGAANASPAPLGTNRVLRINEWMANPADGADWFELYNSTNLPVELSGLTLTDDPTTIGFAQFRIAPLSFIGAGSFVKWIADGNAGDSRNHVNFSLNDAGEFLGLYANPVPTNFVLIDAIAFEAQMLGVSEGRLLDGQSSFSRFPGSPSPGASNYRMLPNVRINEVVAHSSTSEGTVAAAVELHNPSAESVNIGGWFLSDDAANFKKHRFADGTIIPAGGYLVLPESQLAASGIVVDSDFAGELWLSEADVAGVLTGARDGVKFGPSDHGISFGSVTTTVGEDFVPLATRTLGQTNSGPRVGPVIISEIMYHPETGGTEYIELQNLSSAQITLMAYDYEPQLRTNTWRLSGGIDYAFPLNASIAETGRLLVVDFHPADAAAVIAFRTRYNIPVTVPIYGPFSGKLDNAGESLSLSMPKFNPLGSTITNGAPYVRVDQVEFDNAAPWPVGDADGGGHSLQRLAGLRYGNEPTNWVAAVPTPGSTNSIGIVATPAIAVSPESRSVLEGDSIALNVNATGTGPLGFQWRFNGNAVPAATNAALRIDYVLLEDDGSYDCVVSNPGGAAVSAAARLNVLAAPSVLIPPATQTNRTGSNTVFSVFARGSTPLSYQWRLNGSTLPGETNTTLTRNGILIADDGQYDVLVSNPVATTISSARLIVLSNTVITVTPPLNISVVTSSFFTVSIQAAGNPLPFSYDWRRGSVPVLSNEVFSRTSFARLQAPTNLTSSQSYRVVVRNLANPGISANFQFFVSTLVDADVDGIPDNWENAHGFSPVNSRRRRRRRGATGSAIIRIPRRHESDEHRPGRLTASVTAGPSEARVSFNAVSNKTYSIEYQDVLGSGWQTLAEILAKGSNRVEAISDDSGATNRFYRVVTPRQP
ncbi:MAG: lamin tail domain-containing protein [Verrucomicrobia bacterium]|nr:lamin tail domain-containing protein [Verrucomicrobiota bacterium]